MYPRCSRIRLWLLPACLTMVFLGRLTFFPPAGTTAQETTGSDLFGLDLAAIAINPLDLTVMGYSSSMIGDGGYLNAESATTLVAEAYRKPPAAAARIVTGNGIGRGYTLTNDLVATSSRSDERITSTLLQAADQESASSTYQALTRTTEQGVTIGGGEATVGDASQIVAYSTEQGAGLVLKTTQITFRSGDLLASVSISAQRPSAAVEEQLGLIAPQLLQKIELVRNGGAPRISYRAVTLQDVTPGIAAYVGNNGQVFQLRGESDASFQTRQQDYSGVTITYREEMEIPSNLPGIRVSVEISGFTYVGDATAWVANAVNRQRLVPGTSSVEVDDAVSPLGDASTTLTYRTGDGRKARQVTAQSGPYTFTITLAGIQSPPGSALQELAVAQLGCLQVDAICGPIPVPAELSPVEPTAAPSPASSSVSPEKVTPRLVTPVTAASPTLTPAPAPTSQTSTTVVPIATPALSAYVDDQYPFTVSFDASRWRIEQQGTTNNRSFVLFSNRTSMIYLVAGKAYAADVDACVQDAADGLAKETGVSAVSPARNRKGNVVAGSSETTAYAVYTYTQGDGTSMARYLECRILEPGVSTLLAIQIVPGGQFNDQIDERNALLAGLRIGSTP